LNPRRRSKRHDWEERFYFTVDLSCRRSFRRSDMDPSVALAQRVIAIVNSIVL
jgi:hypothetical protein